MYQMELSLAVETALNRLNEDQREAVILKVYQGFKFEEMAEILECPVSTVKSRLYTALDLLKTTLAPQAMRGSLSSCPQNIDWKAYALGEFSAEEKRSAATHLNSCELCQDEFAGVQATLADVIGRCARKKCPRRIAFAVG